MSKALDFYLDLCSSGAIEKDQNQIDLLTELEIFLSNSDENFFSKIFKFSSQENSLTCFYLHGNVGSGKTLLMDLISKVILSNKFMRIHFHEFMIKTHNSLHELRAKNYSKDDLISSYAKMIQLEADVIFFDEFQVTNIADAMILSQLFTEFFNRKIKIVLTTNIFPDDLYKDGLQRELFLPFIELIKKKSKIFELDTGKDYRKLNLNNDEVYFSPINLATSHKINDLYIKLSENSKEINKIINVKGREVVIKRLAKRVSRFYFDEICGLPLGAEDYLSMISFFDTIIIQNIKNFSNESINEQLRFINLIDVLYDNNINLVLSSVVNISEIDSAFHLKEKFKRTQSRLEEMKSRKYRDAS
jgi:cell division protein ZapE